MKIIGVCGQSGAGKGTVCAFLARRGIPVIDCDRLYRELTVPGSALLLALQNEFGAEILAGNGELDRKRLAAAVFSDEDRRRRLNAVTFTHILAEIEARLCALRRAGHSLAVLDAPLLFESGADRLCNATVAVTASREAKLGRIVRRDKVSPSHATLRLDSQLSDAELIKKCTYNIENNGTITELEEKTADLFYRITGGSS